MEFSSNSILENNSPFEPTQFKLIENIGTGSFSQVFKTLYRKTNKFFGLKIQSYFGQEKSELLAKEYQILTSFSHDNIVKHYGYFLQKNKVSNGIRFIEILELMETDLLTMFRANQKLMKKFETKEIIQIAMDISCGMQFLFQKNIIYTDIKPSNISKMQNKWKIIDIDRDFSDPLCGNVIPVNQIKLFTKKYASPEILEVAEEGGNAEIIDIKKAAVWSLGFIIYELIYQLEPDFEDLFPGNFLPEIPEKWKDFFLKIFRKNPKEKIFSLKRFMTDLENLTISKIIRVKQVKIKMSKKNIDPATNDSVVTPFSKLQIMWHDPNINNNENQGILVKYSEKHSIKPFINHEVALKFLKESDNHWFLVTSGKNGKFLLPLIHEEPAIIGIVIFCRNPDYHKELASKFKKVIKIVNKSFTEVIENIKPCFYNYLCSYLFTALDLRELDMISKMITKKFNIHNEELIKENTNKEYLSISYDLALQFGLIIKNLLKKTDPLKFDNEKRLQIVEELMELTDNIKEKQVIKERFETSVNPFQAIIYTYSTNAIYRNFNQVLACDEYHRILTLSYLFSCILLQISQNKEKTFQKTLYRGVKRSIANEYMNDKLMFWKPFSSTSLNLETAENIFTEKNISGTIFEIKLSNNNPHPFLQLPNNWTKYKQENEVLLWPNFAFKCVEVRKEKWYDYVKLEQDEKYMIASSDMKNLKNWWKEYVAKKAEYPFDEFFNRLKNRIIQALDFLVFYKAKEKEFDENKNWKEKEDGSNDKDEKGKENEKIHEIFHFKNEKEAYQIFKKKYLEYLKEKLLFSKGFPQEKKRFYQILIRDMKILDMIEIYIEPFLLEISEAAFKIKIKIEFLEMLEGNAEFLNQMLIEIMNFVQKRLVIYKTEVLVICQNYFDEF